MKRHLIFLYVLAFGVLSYESSAETYPFRPLAFTLDTTVTIDITVCFGEMYDGYTTSGTYRDTFDVDGMDSIRILLRLKSTVVGSFISDFQEIAGHEMKLVLSTDLGILVPEDPVPIIRRRSMSLQHSLETIDIVFSF